MTAGNFLLTSSVPKPRIDDLLLTSGLFLFGGIKKCRKQLGS